MSTPLAIITGGAGHIGSQTCRVLASKGYDLAIIDKNPQAAKGLIEELKALGAANSIYVEANLLDSNCFKDIFSTINKNFTQASCLVNNAAFYDSMPGWGGSFEEEGYDAWLSVMKVNLLAPFFLTQALAPLLRKSSSPAIVNVSSIYGVSAPDHKIYEGTNMTNPAAYAASKGGLIQLTKWLSTVLAPEIRVNCVSPGGLERGQPQIFIERYKQRTPLARMATEDDVARTITFLLSPDSQYITGQNILVDGGWTTW